MIGNLTETIKFPFKDKNWIVKVLIGGLLSWIPVVFFLPMGYALQILKDAHDGKKASLPEWTAWDELFKKGLIVFLIGFAYSLVIAILAVVVTLLTSYGGFFAPVFSLLNILVGIGWLLLLPVVTIALCRYIDENNLGAAFDVKAVYSEILNKFTDYLVVSVLVLGIYKVLETALGIGKMNLTGAVSFQLVYLLIPFVMFVLNLIAFRMFGEIYSSGSSEKAE